MQEVGCGMKGLWEAAAREDEEEEDCGRGKKRRDRQREKGCMDESLFQKGIS